MKDRHGRPLQPGQRVRVRECVGPYGQCATREGIIKEISQFDGITLELTAPATAYFRTHCEPKKAGDLLYTTAPRDGYHKHDDFEHGHETWVEIVKGEHP